nr:hypothetical protein [uncultured Butyricicoccus sp.]
MPAQHFFPAMPSPNSRNPPIVQDIPADRVQTEYSRGQAYNIGLDLYNQVKKNERFYLGDQWSGLKVKSFTSVTLNFLRRVLAYFQSMIVSDDIAVQILPFRKLENRQQLGQIYEKAIERVMERTKLKAMLRESLRDAAVDGDSLIYFYFDPEEPSGQAWALGDIKAELVMNTNVIFANSYSRDLQSQPYLLIIRRRTVRQAQEEAKARGIADWQQITSESADGYIGEDKQQDDTLCTEIVRFWKVHGIDGKKHVYVQRVTGKVITEHAKDTGLSLYPAAWWSWVERRNCYHGVSPLTEVIPTQIAVNQLWTAVTRYVQSAAFPKIVYNRNLFPNGFDTNPGKAVAVMGDVREAQTAVIGGVTLPPQIISTIDSLMQKAMEMMGISDSALGNVRPDNQAAIVAVQEAAAAPLALQKLAFYQFVEDCVRVMVDMMRTYYGVRELVVEQDVDDPMTGETNKQQIPTMLDFGALDLDVTEINVDIGEASYWSRIMQLQTADNLFAKGFYNKMSDYLKSLPDGLVRNREQMVKEIEHRERMQAAQQVVSTVEPQPPTPQNG